MPGTPLLFPLRSLGRNLGALRRAPTILAVRQERERPFRAFLDWLERHDPRFRSRFDLRCVGERIWRLSRYRLLLNWTQDPLCEVDPQADRWLRDVERRVRAAGAAIVNPVEACNRSRKSVQLRLLAEAGFRVPAVGPWREVEPPLVVRSDIDHSQDLVLLEDAGQRERFEASRFREPVGQPFLDTRCADGVYRRYRYVMAGARGAPRSLLISRHWCVRRRHALRGPEQVAEEEAYLAGSDPHHADLDRARRLLGFDFVGFDYSLDRDGRLVIWEANPFPAMSPTFLPGTDRPHPAGERFHALWRDDLVERFYTASAP